MQSNLFISCIPLLDGSEIGFNDWFILFKQFSNLVVDSHTTYGHNSSISDFLVSVAHVLEVDLVEKVKMSNGFSVMLDELTDVSVHQNMIVHIRILVGSKSGVVTKLKSLGPGILSTHCIAHRLALSCCSGADKISYLV